MTSPRRKRLPKRVADRKKFPWRDLVFIGIRCLLALSILINCGLVAATYLNPTLAASEEIAGNRGKYLQIVMLSIVSIILTLIPDFIERRGRVDIPDLLEIFIIVFIYAAIILSVQFDLYYRYFWWDDLLHTLSGVIVGFVGFLLMYGINRKYSLNINPLLVAVFAFAFAVTVGTLWEILEFASDAVTGTAHQKWDLPETAILMGKPYQGSGLRDTMSDLIVDSVGALITSAICFLLSKFYKRRTLRAMRKIYKEAK